MALKTVKLGSVMSELVRSVNDNFAEIEDTKASSTNVLTRDNAEEYTPSSPYQPATKKYVDDAVSSGGYGDMTKNVYDANSDGVVNQADRVTHSLVLNANGGTAEGVERYTYDGSASKTIEFEGSGDVTVSADTGKIIIGSTPYSGSDTVSISSARKISLATSGAAAGVYGTDSNIEPDVGDTITVPSFTIDAYGRVINAGAHTVRLPGTDTTLRVGEAAATGEKFISDNPQSGAIVLGTAAARNVADSIDANTSGEALPKTDAVRTFVRDSISSANAMVFKGTLNAETGTITSAVDSAINGKNIAAISPVKSGWMMMVSAAGTIWSGKAGAESLEVGDIVLCVSDYTSPDTTGEHWTAIQVNLSGAVTSSQTTTVTGNPVAVFDANKNIIKSSGHTIASDVPENAEFTDTKPVKMIFSSTDSAWASPAVGSAEYTLTLTIPEGRYAAAVYRQNVSVSTRYELVCVGISIVSDTTLEIASYDKFSGYVVLV